MNENFIKLIQSISEVDRIRLTAAETNKILYYINLLVFERILECMYNYLIGSLLIYFPKAYKEM